MSLPKGTKLDRYEIDEKLGSGSMGDVYSAWDSRLERKVAIKALPPKLQANHEAASRFRREGRAIAALSHPNIRAIHDIAEADEHVFAVMELLEGETLGDRMKRARLNCQEALRIAKAIAKGLEAAHIKGIIHRDLKPYNVFLSEDGQIKILDFGLARMKAPGSESEETELTLQTQMGVMMGTIHYMSPEQVRGETADARSDVFSFGTMFYEMLTGKRPFARKSSAEILAAILSAGIEPIPQDLAEAALGVEGVIRNCLAKNPVDRLRDGKQLGQALQEIGSEIPATVFGELSPQATGTDHGTGSGTRPPSSTSSRSSSRERITGSASIGFEGSVPDQSIAVLPFADMSPQKDQGYFCDGMADELINGLSTVDGLFVASRTSAFAFRETDEDIRTIGERLKVATILEGSVRKAGSRVRINAKLICVADGYQLWSSRYDRDIEDVFAVQDEIAEAITQAMKVVLTEAGKDKIAKGRSENIEAYESYLRGRQCFYQFRHKSMHRARLLFQTALEIDPSYAAACAGLADCNCILHCLFEPSGKYLVEGEARSLEALELDPTLAEAHVSRGFALSLHERYDEATQRFDAAIEIDPDLYEAWYLYARACVAEGKMEKAAELFEKAITINPDTFDAPILLAGVYAGLGNEQKATAATVTGLNRASRHLKLYPDDSRALQLGASAQIDLGNREIGLKWTDRALAVDPDDSAVLYNAACSLSQLGDVDRALGCLESSVERGMSQKQWFENDRDLDPLRASPRFKTLIERL